LILNVLFNLLGDFYFLVGYINNGNSFPHPLSESEEKSLFEKYRLGDESARVELISRNLRLIVHVIKKFNIQGNSEDLISIGSVGLIKAIENFDYLKGNKLASYASKCIENEILMYIRSNRKVKAEIYLEDPIGVDKDGNAINLLDVLGTDVNSVHDEVESKITTNIIYELIELILDNREKLIIKLRYGLEGEPKTQADIAKLLKISRSYVSRIESKALKKLQNKMSSTKFDCNN
jgi:RNA polymerase sporulation-specific sigma factor